MRSFLYWYYSPEDVEIKVGHSYKLISNVDVVRRPSKSKPKKLANGI